MTSSLSTVGQLGGNGGFCLIAIWILNVPFLPGRFQTSQHDQNATQMQKNKTNLHKKDSWFGLWYEIHGEATKNFSFLPSLISCTSLFIAKFHIPPFSGKRYGYKESILWWHILQKESRLKFWSSLPLPATHFFQPIDYKTMKVKICRLFTKSMRHLTLDAIL